MFYESMSFESATCDSVSGMPISSKFVSGASVAHELCPVFVYQKSTFLV